MTFQGTPTFNSSTQKYNYQFQARVGACSAGGVDALSCPNFPQALFPGGNMAIAANGDANATLWAAVTYTSQSSVVSGLYGYKITSTTPFLAKHIQPCYVSSQCRQIAPGSPRFLRRGVQPVSQIPHLPITCLPAVTEASNSSGVIKGGVIQVFGACQ